MYFVSYQLAQAMHLERLAEVEQFRRRPPSRRLVHSLRGTARQLTRLADRLDPSPCT